MAINVKEEIGSVSTLKEFEKVLGIFKEKYPEKYAVREASGDFDRQAKSLGIAWESEAGKLARKEAEAAAKAKAKADAK